MPRTVAIDLAHPTGNFWVDNGRVVLAKTHKTDRVDLEQAQVALIPRLERRDEDGSLKWTILATSFIDGQKLKALRIHGKPLLRAKDFSKHASKTCMVCGRQAYLTDIKQFLYPFIVEGSKFSNFLPYAYPRASKLCPECGLASLMGYAATLWLYEGGRKVLHLFLFHTHDLGELLRFHREVLDPLTLTIEKMGNLKIPFWGSYTRETTLALLLELFTHVDRSDRLSETGRSLLARLFGATEAAPIPMTLYAISGERTKRAFQMTAFWEFSRFHSLYRLYQQWLKVLGGIHPHTTLIHIFQQFQARVNQNLETLWRDRIAWAVLEWTDPLPPIEDFLYQVRARTSPPQPLAGGTEDVFSLYMQEVLGMNSQLDHALKGFGHRLGRAASEHNEMGLLYSLRNARNPDEFLRVLNDVQFRLELTVPEEIVHIEPGLTIQGTPWVRVKTLLSIYAMNAYLWNQSSREGGSE